MKIKTITQYKENTKDGLLLNPNMIQIWVKLVKIDEHWNFIYMRNFLQLIKPCLEG